MENISFLHLVSSHIAGNPLITLSSVCVILIYIYFKISFTYWQSRGVPQMNPSFPFGNMASVVFRRQNLANKLKQIYELAKVRGHRYVGLYSFNRKNIVIVDPVLIKDILKTKFDHFSDRGLYYDEKNDPLNAHLISLKEPKWRKLRAKLTPAYTPKQLRNMFGTLSECGLKLRDFFEDCAGADQPIELKETLDRYSSDVIGSVAYGLEYNTLRNPNNPLRVMSKRATTVNAGDYLRIITIKSLPKLAQIIGLGLFSHDVTKFFRDVLREIIEYREEHNIRRDDFLQILIQLKNKKNEDKPADIALTIDEAAAQAFIFLLAGYETTSAATSFAIFELAMNKDVQERARAEVRSVLEKHGGNWSYEAIQELTYLDMVIRETLRKYPPVASFIRKCTRSYQFPDSKVVIEAGITCLIPTLALHTDPEYFPNPDLFCPERFSEENRSKIWDYTYIPFGDGPRMCIAMRFSMVQMKITLSLLLNNFIFHANSKTKYPISLMKYGLLLAPAEGLWINVESAYTKKTVEE